MSEAMKTGFSSLATILGEIRLSDCFYCRTYCHPPWGVVNPAGTGALFHYVVQGRVRVETTDGAVHFLEQGDLILLPRGDNHILKSSAAAPIIPFETLPVEKLGAACSRMVVGQPGDEETILICGGLTFAPSWHPIFESLPVAFCLQRGGEEGTPWIESLIAMMEGEVRQDLPGSETVIIRLCEVLVVGAIRNWALSQGDTSFGWVEALKDEAIGQALAGIHQDPGQDWSVARLAGHVALSRTVFAERFSSLVGIPPMQYLTSLRMNRAGDLLRGGGGPEIGEIAAEMGYSSEVSFRRAFKNFWGVSPGRFRREPISGKPFGLAYA